MSRKRQARDVGSRNFVKEYNKLKKIVRNRYHYETKDIKESSLSFDYAEKICFETGRCGIHKNPTLGLISAKVQPISEYRDIYGKPSTYKLYSWTGEVMYDVDAKDPNFYLLADDYDYFPYHLIAMDYAEELARIRDTIETNVNVHKHPYVISTPKDKIDDMRNALDAVANNTQIIKDDKLNLEDKIKVFDLKIDPILDKLEDEYNVVFNQFCKTIGFSNQNVDKKERLVVNETRVGYDVLIADDIFSYKNRVNFVKWLKEMGTEVELLKSNDYIYEMLEQENNVPGVKRPGEMQEGDENA